MILTRFTGLAGLIEKKNRVNRVNLEEIAVQDSHAFFGLVYTIFIVTFAGLKIKNINDDCL